MNDPRRWKRLAPGVYRDSDGAMHLVTSELLRAHGYEDTAENRATLLGAAREVFESEGIAVDEAP